MNEDGLGDVLGPQVELAEREVLVLLAEVGRDARVLAGLDSDLDLEAVARGERELLQGQVRLARENEQGDEVGHGHIELALDLDVQRSARGVLHREPFVHGRRVRRRGMHQRGQHQVAISR